MKNKIIFQFSKVFVIFIIINLLFPPNPIQSDLIYESFELFNAGDKIRIFNDKNYHNITLMVNISFGNVEILWSTPNYDVPTVETVSTGNYIYNIVSTIILITSTSSVKYSQQVTNSNIDIFRERLYQNSNNSYYANGTYQIIDHGIIDIITDESPYSFFLLLGLFSIIFPLGVITLVLIIAIRKNYDEN